jgi:glycosyltransferase involved in cell wall biosynthesis
MLHLTVWMNMPSFYQDDMFRALTGSEEVDLEVIFAKEMTSDRVQLGWRASLSGYRYRMLGGRFSLLRAMRIAWAERDRVHVVNGIWSEPTFAAALSALALSGSTFAVYAEAPDPTQPRPKFKRLLRKAFGRWIARHAIGILAVSRLAVDFYGRLGFRTDHIYPFGYFQSNNTLPNISGELIHGQKKEIIFVGQLIHRKAWDVLLKALQPLFADYPSLRLTIVGDGEDASLLQQYLNSLGLASRVLFEGAIASEKIRPRIATADVLVLPSRWDGWGMVVNEAFSVGVPVIASDRCGASDLIRHGENGYVFRSEDVEDLRHCLRNFLDNPSRWLALRAAAANTGRSISADVAAHYLIHCIKHMTGASTYRPDPPWARLNISRSLDR